MEAIDMLMTEHQMILKILKKWIEKLPDFSGKNISEAQKMVEFVQVYVDEYHHGKEEKILFKWMLDQNPQLQYGPIACMLKEHDQGRELISHISLALNDLEKKPDDLENRNFICSCFISFVSLLEEHIAKEDGMLYQFALDIDRQCGNGDATMLPLMSELNVKMANKASELEQLSQ